MITRTMMLMLAQIIMPVITFTMILDDGICDDADDDDHDNERRCFEAA